MSLLIPPFRFAAVEEDLFRGAYPTLKNFRYLKRLQLKTMISLTPEPTTPDLLSFCQMNDIQHHQLRVPKYDEAVRVTQAMVAQVIQVMINPDALPLFIHCLDGLNVTGLFIMCFRKLQNWATTSIYNEFSRFSTDDQVSSDEAEFVEQFRHEIFIPETIPTFLWGGNRLSKHPTVKIRNISISSPEAKSAKVGKEQKDGKRVHRRSKS
eukprot:TRINITY_DN9375_c0_g1_i1.p1 TRINITY_DN9375_c0_g1~~TRINITY_DN9375_c0_g1_i1.p1  ORF type:complete len:209 (+),score=35.28 TRINITY_DN9375_c0_g1_i1:56-682(+)